MTDFLLVNQVTLAGSSRPLSPGKRISDTIFNMQALALAGAILWPASDARVSAAADFVNERRASTGIDEDAAEDAMVGGVLYSLQDATSAAAGGVCTLEQFDPLAGTYAGVAGSDQVAYQKAFDALNAGTFKALRFMPGKTYEITGAVLAQSGCSIYSDGTATLHNTGSQAAIRVQRAFAAGGTEDTQIYGFKITGTGKGSVANQNGIEDGFLGSDGTSRLRIMWVQCYGLGDRCFSVAYSPEIIGPLILGCRADQSGTGIYGGGQVDIVGTSVNKNNVGVVVGSGNVSMTGGDLMENLLGITELAGGNDGHGIFCGVQMNHNTTLMNLGAVSNGHTFVGCHMYQGTIILNGTPSGGTNPDNVTGRSMFSFRGCTIDATSYDFRGCLARFSGGCIVDTGYFSGYSETAGTDVDWGDTRHVRGDLPSWIGQRLHVSYTFALDADAIPSAQQCRGKLFIIEAGGPVLLAPRTLTFTRSPSQGEELEVANFNAQTVNIAFATGTSVAVPSGTRATIIGDGVNARRVGLRNL